MIKEVLGNKIYYNINTFPYTELLKYNYITNNYRNPKNRIDTFELIMTLDTETYVDRKERKVKKNGKIKKEYYSEYGYMTDIMFYIENIGVLYVHTWNELNNFLQRIKQTIHKNDYEKIIIYIHNLSYDYSFLRNFLLRDWGLPTKSLSVKTQSYISIQWGFFEFRDSFILTQKKLAKLAEDEKVVEKLVDGWDYKKFRTPFSERTDTEIQYATRDVIALGQALRSIMNNRKVNTATIPLTMTGFPRQKVRKIFQKIKFRQHYLDMLLTPEEYEFFNKTFHGGYVHANRHWIGKLAVNVDSYDFASSYPFVMLSEKYPMEKFKDIQISPLDIIQTMDEYAYIGVLQLTNVRIKKIKGKYHPMPSISVSKTYEGERYFNSKNVDNGRLLRADKVTINFIDTDLKVITSVYDFDTIKIGQVKCAKKDYLPLEFRKLIHELFYDKSTKKDSDPINYQIAKSLLNSLYGMIAQKVLPDVITEDYETGLWNTEETPISDYEKESTKYSRFLPFQWCLWVTGYAQKNLYELGSCCGLWLYSDTDSVKGKYFDTESIKDYNNRCVEKLKNAGGLGIVKVGEKTYTLGIAEMETKEFKYTEFVTNGCKRYCYRQKVKDKKTGEITNDLHLTVAGVPKEAVAELHNDILNFIYKDKPIIFHSEIENGEDYKGSNKLTPKRYYPKNPNDIIIQNINGEMVETASWTLLFPADYNLNPTELFDPYNDEMILPIFN